MGKQQLLNLKVMKLETYRDRSVEGGSVWIKVWLQAFAVVLTILVSSLSAYSILSVALLLADAMHRQFRSPRVAWIATMAAAVTVQVGAGVLVLTAAFAAGGVQPAARQSSTVLHSGLHVFGGYLWI